MFTRRPRRRYCYSILLLSFLILVLVTGCGNTASPGATPTPRVTATATTLPKPTPTATQVVPTPTLPPGKTPTPQPKGPCDTGAQPVSATEIDIGDTSQPRIALTFDAGGPAAPTSQILDILAKHGVHVTFFVTGDWANANPDLVRRIHNDGHEIGNHTMHHPDLATLSNDQICTELNQADQVISALTGLSTRPYYRPPYGSRDDRVRGTAAHIGYRTVYWTIDTIDWRSDATPDSITQKVMNNLRNGAIVLMHAGSQVEAETLDGLMTKIEQKGYQIVTVTEVLQ